MDAHTSLFAPSGTTVWSRLYRAIESFLRVWSVRWHTPWPAPRATAVTPTRLLDTHVNGRATAIPTRRDAWGQCDEIAAAAELANRAGGLETALVTLEMNAAQVWLEGCAVDAQAPARIAGVAGQLLQIGVEASPQRWLPLGCIPALEIQDHGGGALGVTLYTDCGDALGRDAIESAARAMAAPLAGLVGCTSEPVIQLGEVRAVRARVRCRVGVEQLLAAAAPGELIDATLRGVGDEVLSWFGVDRHQPELAASHNAYVLEGASSAATALGLEPWRFSAAAQNHAARWGSCEPLVRWRRKGGELMGQMEVPIDLESVCRALHFVGDDGARREVARRRVQLVAGVGLLASLAYVCRVMAANLRQSAMHTTAASPAESGAAPPFSPPSGIAESGVRPIAPRSGASRSRAG